MIYILMFIIGACIGSFLCCEARRLHIYPKKLGSRSVCLHCNHKLKWYENIPIISWLIQKGKCRKCGEKIGTLEFYSEILTAIAFVLIAIAFAKPDFTPINFFDPHLTGIVLTEFIVTLIFTSLLIFLAIYDGAYGELPVVILIIAIAVAVVIAILKIVQASTTGFTPELILKPLGAALILGGLYLVLYLVSHGKWVGDGDWLLGLAIALALGTPLSALMVLAVANVAALVFAIPKVKKTKNHEIHLGPFLVFAYVIIVLCISLKVIH
jgi:leader peptidase (prepilin peptidase)/N-methyltransferase